MILEIYNFLANFSKSRPNFKIGIQLFAYESKIGAFPKSLLKVGFQKQSFIVFHRAPTPPRDFMVF
jgi:hypothetical protein